ncbi:caspase-like [Drosophila nasuta]|uniref:caspase-like n=1 Tax=Drosophila nasuta TaxID=42062 RepID=UPI00295F0DAA|nr:caspase-like [Drosophila nasuta]
MNNDDHNTTDGNCFTILGKTEDRAGPKDNVARMVTGRYANEYKMNHKYRGLALIFGHEHFDVANLQRRIETDVDTKNLTEALTKLDFCVRPFKDLSHKEVMEKIKETVEMDHTEHDCILIAVLSYGECDLVYAKDTFYRMDDLWNAFTADKCPTLTGKPKLFIVEANRGRKRDMGYRMSGQTQTDSDSPSNYRIPIHADFLVAFSSIPNYCTWSDSLKGSWFIYSLCQELLSSGRKMDLLMLLTFVGQRVAVDFESYDEGYKQITCTMSTLTRIVYFDDHKIDHCA